MPVTGYNSSYVSTMSLFFQHWEDVNGALGSALVLSDARDVAGFEGLLDLVQLRISETSTALFAAANLKGALDGAKADLISWTVIFNATVRADHAGRSLVRNLVPAPQQSAGLGTFIEPVVQTQQIWADLDAAAGAPVVIKRRRTLPNGSIQTELLDAAGYEALCAGLLLKWSEWTRAQQSAQNKRAVRNEVMKLAYVAMRDYRAKVVLELPPGHALVNSLPALNADNAARLDAPEASGAWDAGAGAAILTAVPGKSAEVDRHELRYSPDAEYNEDNEAALVSIPAGQPLIFSTDMGLAVPGDVSRFTWVALTRDGREARSKVVAVRRT
jgi:hypothetical protein